MCCSVLPGQWGCVCPSHPSGPHDLVFLSAGLQLFLKGNFLKIHLFLSLITSISLVSGSSNSQLFLLLSDWMVKWAGVQQKRYLPFIICKLPSGYKVGVYGFKLIRATEQSFVMCITWGEEKHLKFRATFSREENCLVTAIVDLGMCFRC